MDDPLTIRPALPGDLEAITAIYNDAVMTTTATFDTEPKSPAEQLAWLHAHGGRFAVLVAAEDGVVLGWTSLSRWSDRSAYDDTAETSVYVRRDSRGRGIGRKLEAAIIEHARNARFHTLIARIAGESRASLRLHESLGFVRIGTMKEVGRKFGRLLDVHMLQMMLG
ncbi:MAG TPA: GNAT family N-acetyltransferase [Bacteroidota bacterium]|nr:GNAT family N-acetyltransferase [Bacteroidota bacterium]